MAWQQLSLTTSAEHAETFSALFEALGAVSVTLQDAEDQPIFEPPLGTTPVWPNTQVTALFPEQTPEQLIHLQIDQQLSHLPYQHWTCTALQEQVWERVWLDHFKPLCFADRLWICPTGQEQHPPGTVCLTLDPGLAFGTGTHPTTALCLDWLARQDLNGLTVIDYGCGSGILAIASLALGAASAVAIDIDEQALLATRANAEKNALSPNLNTYFPEQAPDTPADLVIANILAGPLLELVPVLQARVRPGGWLLLSGLLENQADAICQAYRPAFSLTQAIGDEGWCLLSGQRTG
ncbi:MAG: 50S ribosomal protein L11 methyltransferase [Methylococcales bacterium]|nr:50S ribosomal protein L11 methyltransferase [Methylococcales bacterium]